MKTILFRIGITIAAFSMGILLVSGMTFLGNESAGPIDNLIGSVGHQIADFELDIIIHDREVSRSKNLSWFEEYRKNKSKLNNPTKILMGAYDNRAQANYEPVVELEDSLDTNLPLIHIYVAWGDKATQEFPLIQTRAICSLGSLPVITWEPWLTDFNPQRHPTISNPNEVDKSGMKDVADGVYDEYITKWANSAKELKYPVFLRFGHEMNDPYRYPWGPQNNTNLEFIAAWKHVHDVFKQVNANNVIWVWAPHPAYIGCEYYYPGDEYVDWIGTGTLNYGTAEVWSKWWSFDDTFGDFYKAINGYKKPVMITEFGSLAVGGDRVEWYKTALSSLPNKYPLVKSVIFYHSNEDNTTTNKSLNWYIKNDKKTISAVKIGMKSWGNI